MSQPFLENTEDAAMRLNNSLVCLNGVPIFIYEVRGDFSCFAYDLQEQDEIHLDDIREENIDYTPVPLGYVNELRGNCLYVRRVPRRRWKQGLNAEAVAGNNRLTTKQLCKTILGDFPTLKNAIVRASDRGLATAFHREWRVSPDLAVEYKGMVRVGDIQGDEVRLDDDYLYLKEALEEVMDNEHK